MSGDRFFELARRHDWDITVLVPAICAIPRLYHIFTYLVTVSAVLLTVFQMEILLSCPKTRTDQYILLASKIDHHSELETNDYAMEAREDLRRMAILVRDQLDRDENDELRFKFSPPLTSSNYLQAGLRSIS